MNQENVLPQSLTLHHFSLGTSYHYGAEEGAYSRGYPYHITFARPELGTEYGVFLAYYVN